MHGLIKHIAIITALALPSIASADVNIFACEPEWGALAKEVGGDKVSVTTAVTAHEDPHHVRAKPSLLAAMRKASLVVCSGASLEVGWLPVLVQKAGGAQVQPGAPGYLMAADYVPRLEVPASLDRAQGDIHPEGNPHIHLNPHNIALVAAELEKRLEQADAPNAAYYQSRHAGFSQRWSAAMRRWEVEGASLRGMPVVTHHKSLTYLLDWLGMREIATLEPKPGIPPTAAHLEELLQTLKRQPAKAILRTPYEPDDASAWLAAKTGTPALMLPYTVGGDAESGTLFALFGRTLALLRSAPRG